MNEISVPVKLQIQNLQSLMSELQGKLSNLKIGSTGFKNLQSVISAIGSEIDRLQIQTSKPFMSEAQFKTAERSVEKLEDQIEKLSLSVGRIKFSDLNLTPQQQSDIKGFEDQLESIKTNLKMVKDTAKQEFLNTDLGKQWATIDSTAFSKSLSQITANIRSEVKKQQDELNKLQETATNYQNALKQNNSIKKFLQNTNKDPISANSMGNLYDQLFNKNGVLKSGKNSGKKLIEQWLEQQLELDPEIISRLVNNLKSGAGRNISTQLTEALQKIMKDNSAVIKANPTAEVDFKQKEQEVQNLINILREAGVSEQSIVVAEQALRQQLDSTKQSFNDYQNAAARAAQENMNVDSTTAAFKSQLTSLRSTLDQTNAKFLQMQRTTQSFNQMKMAITNFMGFNQVLNITKNAVREAMNHIKELDSVMNGISIVTDMTTDDLWKQVDAYSEMAQNYGVSIKGAYEVSQIYYQQGLKTNDVLTLTNETLKLAKISGLDYAQTTDYMTTALRGFKMEMSDASTIVDVYSNLAANTAVSQEELAVAMSKTASSMESVGSTFEDTSAMIATMVAVTRESATNIGSAMKSIASRYGELTKDPTKLVDADGEAMAFNKVDSALQSVGISMKTVDGQFRNFTEVIVELAEKWDQLESTQQRYIATQFAGNRQQSRFLALVSNKDILKANMEVANNSEDVGTLQALKVLDSIEAKTEQVRVAYQQFYTTIGMQDVWKTFLDGTKNVINTLNSLPKLFDSIPIGAVAAIANTINLIKTLLNAGLNILANNFKNLLSDSFNQAEQSSKDGGTKVGRSWWQSVIQEIRTGKSAIQAEMSETMNPTNQQSVTPNISNTINNSASGKFTNFVKALGNSGTKLHGIMTGLSSVLTTVGMVIKKDTVEGQKLAGTITSIGGTLQGLTGIARVAMNPADLGGWLQAAQGVMNLVNGIGLAWETAEEKLERLNKEAEELSNNAKEVKANYNILDRSVKKLNELKDKQYESEEAAEEYKSVMNEIAEKYPELIQGFDEVGNAIVDTDEAERRLAEARRETAKATYEALEKEREAQKQSLDNQKEKINEYSNKVSEDSYGEYLNRKEQHRKQQEQINPTTASENSYRSAFNVGRLGSNIAATDSYHLSNFFKIDEKGYELAKILGFSQEEINAFGELSEIKNALGEKDFSQNEQITSEIVEFLKMFGITLNGLVSDTIESTLNDIETVYDFILSLKKNKKINLEDFEKFRKAYNKLSEEEKNNLGISQEEIKDLTEKIQAYVSDSNKYTSTDKQTIQSWLKYKQAEKEGYDWINESSYSLILLSKKLSELAEGQEYESVNVFMEGNEAAKGIVEAYKEFYNSLNETQKEIYEKYLKDSSSYTTEDLWERLEKTANEGWQAPEKESDVGQIIEDGMKSTEETKQNIENYYNEIKNVSDQTKKLYESTGSFTISSEFSQLITQALEEVQTAGNTNLAENLSAAYQELFKQINDATPEIRNIIIDTILSGNLLTKEGILDILSKLKQTSPEAASHVEEYLNKISDLRKTNIVSLSQALLADAEEEVEKTGKLLSKANKQMSGKEAANFIDYINGLSLTDKNGNLITIDYGDFDSDASGKLAVKDQVLIELQNAFEKSLFNRLSIVDNAINKYEKLFSQDKNTKQISLIEENINNLEGQQIDAVDGLKDFLESNGVVLEELLDESGNISTEGANIIQQKAQEVVNSYNNTVKAYTLLLDSFIQDSKWAQGIYGRSIDELKALVSNNNLDRDQTEDRAMQDYVKKSYNTFISDILKKGFENININDYEGLVDVKKEDLTGKYEAFINKYIGFLGLSIEEQNDLILEAIEKDRKSTSGEAKDALSKIDFYAVGNNKARAYGSLSDAKALASALGISLNNLLGEYVAGIDQYELKIPQDKLNEITNKTDILLDSVTSVLESITKYITSGIAGKLQNSDITNLNAQLEIFGVSQDKLIKSTDYYATQDGLKLTEAAAIRIYNVLQKIDGIQAEIVFNDLNKSLSESNNHYKDSLDLLKRIKELRNAIEDKEGNINTTKKEQYEAELAVAEKIARVRAITEDDSFKFMDNKLEGGLNNPVNYLNAWGKANKVWNEAIKDAQDRKKEFKEGNSKNKDFDIYLDVNSFTNIVNELNRLADKDNEIEFLGHKLNGSLKSVSELLEEGYKQLSNVDGEGAKINLSNLGVDLENGGKLLNKHSHKAIKEVAESQIKLIDGMIALFETLEVLNQLDFDVNADGLFNAADMFEGARLDEKGELIEDSVEKFSTEWKALLGDLETIVETNPDIKKNFEDIKYNNRSLLQIIQASEKDAKDIFGSYTKYSQFMMGIYTLMTSNDYDLSSDDANNLFNSLITLLQNSGLDGKFSFKENEVYIGRNTFFKSDEDTYTVIIDGEETTYENKADAMIALSDSLLAKQAETTKDVEKTVNEQKGTVTYQNVKIGEKNNTSLTIDAVVDVNTGEVSWKTSDDKVVKSKREAVISVLSQLDGNKGKDDKELLKIAEQEYGVVFEPKYKIETSGKSQEEINQKLKTITDEQIEEAIKKATKNEDGFYTIDLQGIKITSEGQPDTSEIDQLIQQSLSDDLSTQITSGITKAFQSKAVKKAVATAVSAGMKHAFKGAESTTEGIPLPEIKLIPEKVVINVPNGTKPTWGEDGEPTFDSIPLANSLPVSAQKVSGTATTTLSDFTVTLTETGTAILKKGNSIVTTIEIPGLTATGTGTLLKSNCNFTFNDDNKTGTLTFTSDAGEVQKTLEFNLDDKGISVIGQGTAKEIKIIWKEDTSSWDFTDIPKDVGNVGNDLIGSGNLFKLLLAMSNESGASAAYNGEAITLSADIPQADGTVTNFTITKVTGNKTLTDISDVDAGQNVNATAKTAQISADDYNLQITTLDENGEVIDVKAITIPATVLFGDKQSLSEYLQEQDVNVDIDPLFNTKALQDLINTGKYTAAVKAEIDTGDSDNPDKKYEQTSLAIKSLKRGTDRSTIKEYTDYNSAKESDLFSQNKDSWGSHWGLTVSSEVTEYLAYLQSVVEKGQTLTKNQVENLRILKELQPGSDEALDEEASKMRATATEILNNNKDNAESIQQQYDLLKELFQGLDSKSLQEVAEAMASIAASAKTLEGIGWDTAINGINRITATNVSDDNSLEITEEDKQKNVFNTVNSKIILEYANDITEEVLTNDTISRQVELMANGKSITDALSNLTASVGIGATTETNDDNTNSNTPTVNPIDISGIDTFINAANNAIKQIGEIASSAEEIKKDKIEDIQKAQDKIKHDKVDAIQTAQKNIQSNKVQAIQIAQSNIKTDKIDAVKNAINNLSGNITLGVSVNVNVSSEGDGDATGNVTRAEISTGIVKDFGSNGANFEINNAYAKGTRKTLMGELGPELVVSNGRYFIVGQNGAEMVDLASDAIVFNHLQTKKLLSSGKTGRGKPLTNERAATSLATGNVNGPAMANASAALAALKELKAMWQGMLSSTLQELGSMAGLLSKQTGKSGGGGNKGSGTKSNKNAIDHGVIADLERWYNLLRQISLIEKEINHEEKLRQKILGDLVANGKEVYESQKRQLKALQDTIVKQEELSFLQKSYYEDMRKALAESAYGQLFTFTEDGMMQYKERGFERLSDLNSTLANGAPKYTARQQYNILLSWGFDKEMQYDTSGKKIERYEEKTSTDSEGNETTTQEEREEFYSESVQVFWDKIDNWKKDLDELFDTYTQTQNDLLDAETKRNEILKAIQENQLNLENQVLDAIEHQREEVIENLEKEKDAIDKTTKAYIDGLNKQLEQEKKFYQKQKSDEELNKARRQLGILQRSGGSASQIESLKQQIAGLEQTAYFDKQQEQIDAVQEASNKEIERLDAIIDTEKEALEYQKAQGLLWGQVAEIMAGTPGEITNFITQNTPDIIKLSTAGMEAKIEEIRNVVTQWIAKRDDINDIVGQDRIDSAGQSWEAWYAENVNKDYTSQAWTDMYDEVKKAFIDAYVETSDISRAADAARDVLGSVSSNYRSDDYSYDNNFTNKNRGGTSNQNIITKDDLLGIYIDSLGKLHEKTEDGYDHILYDIRMNPYTLSSLKADRDTFEDFRTSTYAHQSMSYERYLKLIEALKQYNNLTDSDNFVQEILEEDVSRTVSNGNSNNNSTYYSSSTKEENDTFQGTRNESSTKNNEELQLSGYKYDDEKHWQEDQYGKKHNEGLHNRNNTRYLGTELSDYCSVCNRYMGAHAAQTVANTIAPTSVTNNTSDNKTNQSSNTNKAAMERAERILNSTGDKVTPEKREAHINALIQEGNLTEEDQKKLKQMIKEAKSNGKLPSYSSGGKVNFTGPAILHGSKTRPEWILNADETKMWKEDILSGRPGSLTYGIVQLQNMINGMVLGNSTNSSTDNSYNGIIIEKVELIMNANIANDYDARRAGSNVMDEIIQIARKTGMNGVRR